MPLPEKFDRERVAEVGLALLYLSAHSDKLGVRAWKNIDWDVMNLLYERGWISNPISQAKSVSITEEGLSLAERFADKHFRLTEKKNGDVVG